MSASLGRAHIAGYGRVRFLIGEPGPDAALRPDPVGETGLGFSRWMPRRPLVSSARRPWFQHEAPQRRLFVPTTQRVTTVVERQGGSVTLVTGVLVDVL